jgi:hypothetical protein
LCGNDTPSRGIRLAYFGCAGLQAPQPPRVLAPLAKAAGFFIFAIERPTAIVHFARLTGCRKIKFKKFVGGRAEETRGVIPVASNHVPPGVKTVTIEQWRGYAHRPGISTSDKANAKRTALSRASDMLLTARKIGIWAPYAWYAR